MEPIPDHNNFYVMLRTSLSPEHVARIYEALGWSIRMSSSTDFEIRCPWAELEIMTDGPILLLNGAVAAVLANAPRILQPLQDASIAYAGECYGQDLALLQEFAWPAK